MANKMGEAIFTPTGTVYKSTDLPKPTTKKHSDLGMTNDELMAVFREMYVQRRFEDRAAQMYQKGKFGGFLHLYIGQEAVSSATNYVLNSNDDIITAYRDHGLGLVRGITPKAGMAELFGKKGGCSNGKGGSMHFFNTKEHFWGGHAIVGAHIPLAAGIAFANKYNNNNRLCICFFGDGAIDQGSLNETFNMAKLWKLPVIFAVENNGYSMGTAVQRHSAAELYKRALGYDMETKILNGMDLFSMIEGLQEVEKHVREKSDPMFLEIRTYRYKGHSMSDPGTYRTKEELDEFKQIDPIERLKSYLLEEKITTEEQLASIEEEVDAEILEAVDYADNAPFPDEEELYHHTYVENDYPFLT